MSVVIVTIKSWLALPRFAMPSTSAPASSKLCLRYAGAARKGWNLGLALKERMETRSQEISSGQLPFTTVGCGPLPFAPQRSGPKC